MMIAELSMTTTLVLWIACCAINTLMAGFFAGIETGIYLMDELRVELDAEKGRRPAIILREMLKNPDRLLSTLLLGTNIHQYVATFSIGTVLVMSGHESNAEWYTMAIVVPLLFILAETTPKHMFRRKTETLVYGGTGLLRIADLLFHFTGLSIIVRLASGGVRSIFRKKGLETSRLARPEPETIAAEGHASGILTPSQAKMAHRLTSIPTVTLQNVMIPLRKAETLPARIDRNEFVSRIAGHNFSRVPLVTGDWRVECVVNVYDILSDREERPPQHFGTRPFLLAENTPVVDALSKMQKAGVAMAIVTGHDERHAGLVTIKDLVEEIVGELEEW